MTSGYTAAYAIEKIDNALIENASGHGAVIADGLAAFAAASNNDPCGAGLLIKKPDGTPKRCHPHMFRDTFAVELLLSGVPIDQVSLLLGHSSVKVTEKHYAPFVKARQEQLENSVKLSWQAHSEWLNQSAPTAVHIN